MKSKMEIGTAGLIGWMSVGGIAGLGLGAAGVAIWSALTGGSVVTLDYGDPKPGPSGSTVYAMPWSDSDVPPLEASREPKTVITKFAGTDRITAVYGDDPEEADSADSYLTLGGKGWGLYGGYVYLTGYWRYLETERVRTITWGTEVVVRIAPAGEFKQPDDSVVELPDRDQIFVIEGFVYVFPKNDDSKPVRVDEGYFVYAHEDDTGEIVLEGPFENPDDAVAPPADAEITYDFLKAVTGS